jgi:hypothetical protein
MTPANSSSAFSQKTVARSVKSEVLMHPLTVYPLAIGLGSLASFGLLASSMWVWLGAGSISLGVAGWLFNRYGRYHAFAQKHLHIMQEKLRKEREAKLERIEASLLELNCREGHQQLEKQKRNYTMFLGVLNEKLNPMEISYGRYLGIVEQVYLATLDNLEKITLTLRSIASIDRAYIERQLRALDENGIENDQADYAALTDRLALLDQSGLRIDELLNANEKAITQLVTTASKLAEIETERGRASMDMEDAMNELSYLTKNIAVLDRKTK